MNLFKFRLERSNEIWVGSYLILARTRIRPLGRVGADFYGFFDFSHLKWQRFSNGNDFPKCENLI